MNVFLTTVAQWLLRASWQAAILALLVLIITWLARSRLSARMRYNLWMLVVLRLILPALPSSPLSIHNLFALPEKPIPIALATPVIEKRKLDVVVIGFETRAIPIARQREPAPPPKRDFTIPIVLSLWLLGFLFLLTRTLIATIKLKLRSRTFTPITDAKVRGILDDARQFMRIRTSVALLQAPALSTPALMGIVNPKILLPTHVLNQFHPSELRLIFLHELAHLRRRDVAVNWLITILQMLHWFNPLIWIAFARPRAERELACDELVLSCTQSTDRREYGNTMIKLLQTFSRGDALPGAVGILEAQAPLRRRITMIAQFDAKQHRTWIALVSCLVLAMICFTDSASGQQNNPQRGASRRNQQQNPGQYQPQAQPQPPAQPGPLGGPGDGGGAVVFPRFANVQQNRDTDASNAQTRDALARRLPDVKLENVTFNDAITYLQDVTGLNFYVDWRAAEASGITKETPITLHLKNVAVSEVLRLVLREASTEMHYQIEGGILVISPLPIEPVAVIKAYNVEDLSISDSVIASSRKQLEESLKTAGDETTRDQLRRQIQDFQNMANQTKSTRMQELVALIENAVAPYTHTGMTVRAFDTKLIITADEAGHQEVAKVLSMLRDKTEPDPRDRPARGASPATP
jgi:beta-lactamase regulating signal transducer with metallopeptidase domain